MKPIRKEVSWKFLDEFRGKIFDTVWPTLPQVIQISKIRFPDKPCFVDFEGPKGVKKTLTYTQVWNNIVELATWMVDNGIKKGSRVAVSGKNSSEWATVYFATMYAGGIAVPIDCALHEKEIDNLLKASKPTMLFVDEEKYSYFSKQKGIKVYSLSSNQEKIYVYNLRTVKKVKLPTVTDKDTAAILFTSGTTGTPKGVMLSHENLVSDCFFAQLNLVIYDTDIFYALLPVHHAYTMQAAMIEPLSCGASVVFGKSMAVSRLMKELKEGQITLMLGVPLLFNKLYSGIRKGVAAKGKVAEIFVSALMNISYFVKKITGKNIGKVLLKSVLEAANLTSIRVAICGGGPLAPSVFKAYNSLGIDFIQGYGLTEAAPIIALNPKEHFKLESVGIGFNPWTTTKIINPNEDGIGEIVVKGPMVMQGYYNMPEETKAVFTEDGFLKTGDLGWIDDEEYIMLSGRAKNIIVTDGGKNVYPEEIEDAFQLYYDVEQIMVRGFISDEEHKSESIEALIYPSDDLLKYLGVQREDASTNASVYDAIKVIVDKVNRTLQPYARISKITILPELLAMTTTRKIKRNVATTNSVQMKETSNNKSVTTPKEKNMVKTETKAKAAAKTTTKKTTTTAKKAPAKKVAAKPAAKKAAPKADAKSKPAAKATAKKAPAKKAATAAKKAPAKKAATTAKKAPAKKAATATKKAPAKKATTATKKAPAKKPAAKATKK